MLHINYLCIITTVPVSKDIKVNVRQFSGFLYASEIQSLTVRERGFEAIRNQTRGELINRKTAKQTKIQAHGCI